MADDADSYRKEFLKRLRELFDQGNADSFQRLSTVFRRGGVMSMLFLIFVTLTAINLSHGIQALRDHYDQLRSDVLTLLAAKQERRRGETEIGVVHAALSALQGRTPIDVKDSEDSIAKYLNEREEAFLKAYAAASAVLPAKKLSLYPLGGPVGPAKTNHHDDFGGVLTMSTDASTVMLNALEVVDLKETFLDLDGRVYAPQAISEDAGNPALPTGLASKTWKVIQASSVIEDPLPEGTAAAYLISPDEILRYHPKTGDGREILKFPHARRWSDASYFARLMDSQNANAKTAPYFDFAGNGIVQTYCRAILSQKSTLLAGICVDKLIPPRLLVEALGERTGLLHAEAMTIDERLGDPAVFRAPLPRTDPSLPRAGDAIEKFLKGTHDPGERDETATRAIRRQIDAGLKLGEAVITGPVRLEVDGESAYFLCLSGSDQLHRGLLIRAGVEFPKEAKRDLLLALLCIIAAAFCAVRAVVVAKVRGEAMVLSDLLRNIETGVAFVDAEDRIVAANDRAEDIIGVPLPRIGSWMDLEFQSEVPAELLASGAEWKTTELFEPRILVCTAQPLVDATTNALPGVVEIPDEHVALADLSRVSVLRRAGLSSTYFARLKAGPLRGHWVRVSGAPVPNSGTRNSSMRTVGLLTGADGIRHSWLEQRLSEEEARLRKAPEAP